MFAIRPAYKGRYGVLGGDMQSPEFRMLLSTAIDIPLSSIEVFGRAKQRQLEGLVDFANGRMWAGIWKEISAFVGR